MGNAYASFNWQAEKDRVQLLIDSYSSSVNQTCSSIAMYENKAKGLRVTNEEELMRENVLLKDENRLLNYQNECHEGKIRDLEKKNEADRSEFYSKIETLEAENAELKAKNRELEGNLSSVLAMLSDILSLVNSKKEEK